MKAIPKETLRIIDANLNRIGEGLRVLEEFARLSLNDTNLTQQLKDMRHGTLDIDLQLQEQLINARDSEGDVGADMQAAGEEKQRDVKEAVIANARRVQESLRVMEETAKAPDISLESDKYKQARFALYTIEKDLLSRILRQDKLKRLTGLYVIIDTAFLEGRSPAEIAAQVIRGGAKVIQLRDKEHSAGEFLSIAAVLKKLCSEHDVLFIVNDSLEVSLAVDADGLHVGQGDLPVATARRLLPIDKILGASARTVEEARTARSEGADYLGVGSIYATATKATAKVVGPGRTKEMRQAVDLPIVAIGGINKSNLREVLKAGADSAAVISAVMGAADIEEATKQLVNVIEEENIE
ncbi:MAG: thiamine phosphate synthase [Dehalococcoidales bacterium]|nr:thiamine phosphate synthase [Dehalococcoidales bacterium]